MKKLIVALLILAAAFILSCNNNNCGCEEVDKFYHAQSGLYWYIITKPTNPITYFYASSSTQLTSATQVGPNDWAVSHDGLPREFSGAENVGIETVQIIDLPLNLQKALQ